MFGRAIRAGHGCRAGHGRGYDRGHDHDHDCDRVRDHGCPSNGVDRMSRDVVEELVTLGSYGLCLGRMDHKDAHVLVSGYTRMLCGR